MESSESIKALTEALCKVQSQLQPARKNADNPFFHSRYADLVEVWENCRKLLADNGFAVLQTLDEIDGKTLLETTLSHISGEWVRGKMGIHAIESNFKEIGNVLTPQGIGSAITYARRYGLCAIVGITTIGEDDDGNTGTGKAHWCAVHSTPFFKTGKMKTYAHPIGSSGQWCYEHKPEKGEPEKELEGNGGIPPGNGNLINLGWLKEKLEILQGKEIPAWTNQAVVNYLGLLTGTEPGSVVEAVQALNAEQAKQFVDQINEAVAEVEGVPE